MHKNSCFVQLIIFFCSYQLLFFILLLKDATNCGEHNKLQRTYCRFHIVYFQGLYLKCSSLRFHTLCNLEVHYIEHNCWLSDEGIYDDTYCQIDQIAKSDIQHKDKLETCRKSWNSGDITDLWYSESCNSKNTSAWIFLMTSVGLWEYWNFVAG